MPEPMSAKLEKNLEQEGSLEILNAIVNNANIGIDIIGYDYKVEFQNRILLDRFGDLRGKNCYEAYMNRSKPCPDCPMKKAIDNNRAEEVELKGVDGRNYKILSLPIKNSTGEKATAVVELVTDITDHKWTEEALRRSEEKYKVLIENADEGIIVAQEDVLEFVNPKIVELTSYSKEELTSRPFIEFIHPDDRRKVAKYNFQRMRGDEPPATHSFRIIDKNGNVKWVRSNSISIIWNGKRAILSFLNDITEHKRTEKELRESLERLQRVIEGNIKAMAITAEVRDPYTAGHQRRVTKLACAIAQEMGLSKSQIDGIRAAATLHDIGKINVPVEILSKPCRLTDIEMNLVRTHPKVGYDILKTEEFSWPIAQIVFQHHERINGTGYPQGVSDEDILLEAKILGVADVVEAMASHRPYRPALGIEKALEEISQNAGILYDPKVVKACVGLFATKEFKF